jgi:hypothetical protein
MRNSSFCAALSLRTLASACTASLFGIVLAALPVRAQGPAMPPPPPDLPISGHAGNGDANAGGAGVPTVAAPAVPQAPVQTGDQVQGGGVESELPLLIQGTIGSVAAQSVVVNVGRGAAVTARRVDLENAVYADTLGVRTDKFDLKKGDSVVIMAVPPAHADVPLDAMVVEKNAEADHIK